MSDSSQRSGLKHHDDVHLWWRTLGFHWSLVVQAGLGAAFLVPFAFESMDYLSTHDQNAWGFLQMYFFVGVALVPLFLLPAFALSLVGYGTVLATRNWSRFEIDAIVVALLLCSTLYLFTNLIWQGILDLHDPPLWVLAGLVLAPLVARAAVRLSSAASRPKTNTEAPSQRSR